MKGITCSEAKDILEKLNRLERLRQGTEEDDEQIFPASKSIFWKPYNFVFNKHPFVFCFVGLYILICNYDAEKYGEADYLLTFVVMLIVFGLVALFFWLLSIGDVQKSELAQKYLRELDIYQKVEENNGKVPKGYTKKECIEAVNNIHARTRNWIIK